jgi:hypothetical protein
MTATRNIRIGLAALLAFAGACSDTTAPTAPAASLEQVFSEASLSSLSAYTGSLTPVAASLTTMPSPSSCEAAGGGWICPTVTISGVTFNRKFVLYDANGAVQQQFASGTTETVRFEGTAHGTVTSGASSYVIDQAQTFVVSGLTTSTHLLNGTSAWSVAQGATVTAVVVDFNDLVLPTESGGYPGGGSIDLTVTHTPDVQAPVHAHLTFDGTSRVAVTLSVGGLQLPSCTVDLSVQNPTCS